MSINHIQVINAVQYIAVFNIRTDLTVTGFVCYRVASQERKLTYLCPGPHVCRASPNSEFGFYLHFQSVSN